MSNTSLWAFLLDGGTLSEIDGTIGTGISVVSNRLKLEKSAGNHCIGGMKPKNAAGSDVTYNAPLYYGFYFIYDTEGSGGDGTFFQDTSFGVSFKWQNASNKVRMYFGSAYAESAALVLGSAHFAEVYLWKSSEPTTWTAEFFLDGVSQGTAVYISAAGGIGELYAGGQNLSMDDGAVVYVWNVYVTDGSRMGPFLVSKDMPTGNSATYDAWTASAGNKWACVDEAVSNDDTDYIYTSVAADKQLLTHGGAGGYAGAAEILAVVFWCKMKGNTSTYPKRLARSGTTDIASTATTLGTYAWQYPMCRREDPNTGAAWAKGAVDVCEFGGSGYYGTEERRLTTGCVLVAYKPYVTGAAALSGSGTVAAAGSVTGGAVTGAAAISGSGATAATGSVGRLGSAALSGSGTATAVAVRTVRATAALAGSGTTAAAAGLTRVGRAALSGSGIAGASGVRTRVGASLLSGVGTLTAVGARTGTVSAALSSSGALTPVASLIRPASAVLAAAGVVNAAGVSTMRGHSASAGGGLLAVVGSSGREAAALLAGAGAVAAAGELTAVGRGILQGTGTAAVSGARIRRAVAVISGASSLGASAWMAWSAAGGLAAEASLLVQGEVGAERLGRADVMGAGALAALGTEVLAAAAAIAGEASLGAAGRVVMGAATALSGAGTASGAGRLTKPGAAALSGSGTAAALGARTVAGGTLLGGAGLLAAQGEVGSERLGRAELSGAGVLTAVAIQVTAGRAAMGGSATATSIGARVVSGAASLAGQGGSTAVGARTVPGAASLAGEGAAVVAAARTVPAAAFLTGGGVATGAGQLSKPGAAVFSGSGTATSTGARTVPASGALAGQGTVAAQAETGSERLGRAVLSAAGAATCAAVSTLPAAAALGGVGTAAAAAVLVVFLTPDRVASFCGEDVGAEAAKSIDDDLDAYWRHSATEYHWIIYDLATEQGLFKIRIYQSAVPSERWGKG